MFNFFKAKSILSAEDIEFQVETYKWLLKHFGGSDFFEHTQLILPTKDFFPSQVTSNEDAALETFNTVKSYANMQNWECDLVQQEQEIDIHIAPTVTIQNVERDPLGTFQVDQNTANRVIITYHPDLVKSPVKMVATFAHELAHYLTAGTPEPPFGGWDNWEFATDITANFLGFGIFMANTAVEFKQFTDVDSQGWQHSRNGYLSEAEHIFSLAIFVLLKDISPHIASKHIKPSLHRLLNQAIKQVQNSDIVTELKSIQYVPWA